MKPGIVIVSATLLTLVCVAAVAGPINEHVKLGLHIAMHEDRGCYKNMPVIENREDFINFWLQVEYPCDFDVFVVLFSYDGVSAAEFGLTWPQEWGSTWYTFVCSDGHLGDIRNPGDVAALAWYDCQSVPVSPEYYPIAWAFLTATTPGEIGILPGSSRDEVLVAACKAQGFVETAVESVFHAGIGSLPYMGPPKVATEPTTWGAIKAMFR